LVDIVTQIERQIYILSINNIDYSHSMHDDRSWKIAVLAQDGYKYCIASDHAGIISKTIRAEQNEEISVIIQHAISNGPISEAPFYNLCIMPDTGIDAPERILITSSGYGQLAAELFIRDEQLLNGATKEFDRIVETDEYIDWSGAIVKPLTESEINRVLRSLFHSRESTIVIALANSHVNPVHEKTILNLLRAAGYSSVVASHSLIPAY